MRVTHGHSSAIRLIALSSRARCHSALSLLRGEGAPSQSGGSATQPPSANQTGVASSLCAAITSRTSTTRSSPTRASS